jgi:putative inorganic carbon (hco3(-)) transporter
MRIARIRRPAERTDEVGTRNVAFVLFCAFLVSYFLHLTKRIPVLGKIHFDLLLAVVTALAIAFVRRARSPARRKPAASLFAEMDPVTLRLWILVGYILATIPFVEWPGSVLHNLEPFGKSLSFFFFVVATVDTTRKLGVLLAVYAFTQVDRVLEPLYMHVTSGYWGAFTSLGNWEYMDRLSGAPWDIINPNGLGFVVIVTLPLLHFLIRPYGVLRRLVWVTVAGAMCYALVLSASRSGFLAFLFLCLLVIRRSRHRVALSAVAVAGGIIALSLMTGLEIDRYRSIVSKSAPGAATAQGRIEGVIEDFKVSLHRPLFGHGIGTSGEANVHFSGRDLISHNLYTEAAEELGYVGLAIWLAVLWSFIRACQIAQQTASAAGTADEKLRFLHNVADSLVVLVAVDLFFSFASYGLSEPYWYFYGGLTVVTARLAIKLAPGSAREKATAIAARVAGRSFGRRAGRTPRRGRVPAAVRFGGATPPDRT